MDIASIKRVKFTRTLTSPQCFSMRVAVQAEFKLFGVLKKEDGWYIAHCPPLDITTQGRTEAEAKKNLIEASELFVVSCFERAPLSRLFGSLAGMLCLAVLLHIGKSRSPFPLAVSVSPSRFPLALRNPQDVTTSSTSLAQTSMCI